METALRNMRQSSLEVDEPPATLSQIPARGNRELHGSIAETDLTEDCLPTNAAYNRLPSHPLTHFPNRFLGNDNQIHTNPTVYVPRSRVPNPIPQPVMDEENDLPIDEGPPTYNIANNPLRIEKERLLTFRKWPKNDIVYPSDLARDGFYYMNNEDYAQCVFCHGILSGWTRGDAVVIEHRRIFPNCPFVRGETNENIPLNPDNNIIPCFRPQIPRLPVNGSEFASPIPPTVNPSSNLDTGVVSQRPKYPDYAIVSLRKQTYSSWPTQMKQTPDQLAKAGFYYMGKYM